MAHFVYILYSLKDKKLYVGCTTAVARRVERHNRGHVLATKNRRPFSLIYFEHHEEKAQAFNRERFLKSLWGGRFKKKVLSDYLNKNAPRP